VALSKKAAALLSMGFTLLLAIVRLSIGMLSGSLSILAEAVDSIIDMVTDGVTYMAVRVADLPPDDNHPYGHARAEHLGALAQAMLMAAVYGWVLWQSIERIFFAPLLPDISPWMFLVVLATLFINVVRVYTLSKTAKQHKSHALAASVSNFRNDIIRSSMVLLALGIIALQPTLALPPWFILRLDALAALIVVIVAFASAWGMGTASIHALMDSIPDELSHRLTTRVSQLPAVVPNSAQVRARFVGEQPYVEVMVGMQRGLSIEEAHELVDSVRDVICEDLHEAQVLVHVEPTRTNAEPYTTAVYSAAHRLGLRVHHLDIYQLRDGVRVEMDLELPGDLTLAEAHTYSESLEAAITEEMPCLAEVAVHLEPRHDHVHPAIRYAPMQERVSQTLSTLPYAESIVKSETLLTDEGLIVTLHCRFAGNTLLTEVHTTMSRMEQELRRAIPDISRVQIDPEPAEHCGGKTSDSNPQVVVQ
jgi:cation diffusion facilitator family transporter